MQGNWLAYISIHFRNKGNTSRHFPEETEPINLLLLALRGAGRWINSVDWDLKLSPKLSEEHK